MKNYENKNKAGCENSFWRSTSDLIKNTSKVFDKFIRKFI